MVGLAACGAPAERAPAAAPLKVGAVGPGKLPLAEPSVEADDASDAWIEPCAAGTPEHAAASKALADVTRAIDALSPSGDPRPVLATLARVAASPCFAIASLTPPPAEVDSGLALKTYWRSGGEAALEARLAWAAPWADRTYWLPPSPRRTLTRESAASHPLAPLLCPAAPGACGAETSGWMLRAEHAFELAADATRARHLDMSPAAKPPDTHETCVAAATRAPRDHAFEEFEECMDRTRRTRDAFPLGSFRAPKDGWLVLRGRRGHHSWCNELRAYDLATGSAYVAATCGAMFGMPPPPPRLEKGRLPVDALREAALMIFLAGTAEHDVLVSGTGHHIPKELDVRVRKERGVGIGLGHVGMSSGRTTLAYQWIRGGKSVANGRVDWPDADRAADDHATRLLAIAEAGLVKGCAPAALPGPIPWAARSDKATRVGGPEVWVPEYDELDFAQLEADIARLGQHATKCR